MHILLYLKHPDILTLLRDVLSAAPSLFSEVRGVACAARFRRTRPRLTMRDLTSDTMTPPPRALAADACQRRRSTAASLIFDDYGNRLAETKAPRLCRISTRV